jgi:tRNA/rRNA methyltransferase
MKSFPSLNLAQAVMVVSYELFRSSMEIPKNERRLAPAEEMERMLGHMEKTLLRIGFLDSKNPQRIMRVLRKLFGRSQMDGREVRILEGIWSQMDHQLRVGKKPK